MPYKLGDKLNQKYIFTVGQVATFLSPFDKGIVRCHPTPEPWS